MAEKMMQDTERPLTIAGGREGHPDDAHDHELDDDRRENDEDAEDPPVDMAQETTENESPSKD